jgi:hypothetical protein
MLARLVTESDFSVGVPACPCTPSRPPGLPNLGKHGKEPAWMQRLAGPPARLPTIDRRGVARRLSTETKAAYKTTEFITYVVVFAGILLASFLVKTGQDGQRVDYFRADEAWWYITLLTIGYMIARGLAKSGSREPYDDDRR